jgi:hypothetical protein
VPTENCCRFLKCCWDGFVRCVSVRPFSVCVPTENCCSFLGSCFGRVADILRDLTFS